MRIIQFITHMHELGGAQMHVFELAKALKNNHHEVVVIGSGTCDLTEELISKGIDYKELKWMTQSIRPLQDVRAFFEARKIFKHMNPEIVAVHSSKAGIIGRLAAKSLRIPVIFTAHSWSFTGETSRVKKWVFTILEKCIGSITDGVIAVSKYDYKMGLNHHIIESEKIQMIHNGIPDNNVLQMKKEDKPFINLLMVARFAEPKDHRLLLRALNQIHSIHWHLTLVGSGPMLAEIKRFTEQLGLYNNVTFVGEVRDVVSQMHQADIFLLISKSEGLPLSIIEAMREGLPVIASNVGGVNELVKHGKQGFIVEKENEQDLMQALQQLMSSEILRKRFGREARNRFVERFHFDNMYQQTESFYKDIVMETGKEKREELV